MPTRSNSGTPEQDALIDELRFSIEQGIAALDRGNYTEVEDEELDAYLDDLGE